MSGTIPTDNYDEEESMLFESFKKTNEIPIENIGNQTTTRIFLHDENDEEEEEDEQIFIPIQAEKGIASAAENILLLPTEEDEDEYDEPIAERQVSEILLAKDEQQQAPSNKRNEITTKVEKEETRDAVNDQMDDGTLTNIVSPEFLEAQNAVQLDVYDISSWLVLIEEVESCRGGNMKLNEAYEQLLKHFPRAAKFWKNLANYYKEQENNYQLQKSILLQGAKTCYNVSLWVDYLNCSLTSYFPDNEIPQNEAAKKLKESDWKTVEEEIELAIESCGLGINSHPLWFFYIDFVKKHYPDTSILDKNKKLTLLRRLYQRCLGIAMDQHEIIWNEYEAFEKELLDINPATLAATGQTPQSQLQLELQEWYKRYLHTKSIYKERKKYCQHIVMDRPAALPTNAPTELQQLQYWNTWINFELNAPDYLHPEQFIPLVRMLFNQCLNAFYYHPEIWLAYAHFELTPLPANVATLIAATKQSAETAAAIAVRASAATTGAGTGENSANTAAGKSANTAPDMTDNSTPIERAKHILQTSIAINPQVIFLRVALAELQELSNDLVNSQEQYATLFKLFPHGITFTWYQRFVYRHVGVFAARKLFSETYWLRKKDPEMALQIYIQHASMEFSMNRKPDIALKVLDKAHEQIPFHCYQSLAYIQLKGTILSAMGDMQQLRHFLILTMQEHGITMTSGSAPPISSSSSGGGGGSGGYMHTNTHTGNTHTGNTANHVLANQSVSSWILGLSSSATSTTTQRYTTAGNTAAGTVAGNTAEDDAWRIPSVSGFGIAIHPPKPRALTSTSTTTNTGTATTTGTTTNTTTTTATAESILRKQYALLSYYYDLEKAHNAIPLLHLYELYHAKHKVEQQLLDLTQKSSSSGGGSATTGGGTATTNFARKGGMYEITYQLMERYQPTESILSASLLHSTSSSTSSGNMSGGGIFSLIQSSLTTTSTSSEDLWSLEQLGNLSENDAELRDRCYYYYATVIAPSNNPNTGHSGGRSDTQTPNLKDLRTMSVDFHLSMSGLPAVVRDFLVKLPSYGTGTYVKPDMEGFLRHMKTVILPPRPLPEEVEEMGQQQSQQQHQQQSSSRDEVVEAVDVLAEEHDEELIQSYDGHSNSRGKHKLTGSGGGGGGDEEDIFRKRSRLSYSTEAH